MLVITKHMIICLYNTASNSIGNFLDYKAFYCLLNTFFFNGCPSQFKCAKTLFFVLHYPSLTKRDDFPLGCAMQWNHFGSGQGKGRWDGVGATVKQAL